ncbi:hypothetical protein GCM10009831_18000 [Dietzia cercidiphylli]|uniref:Uncharacterized protein n=1 Tax=Dietzia cercidiphylli TaxID=498199 RepID=A0ABN2INL9_9ACTN
MREARGEPEQAGDKHGQQQHDARDEREAAPRGAQVAECEEHGVSSRGGMPPGSSPPASPESPVRMVSRTRKVERRIHPSMDARGDGNG